MSVTHVEFIEASPDLACCFCFQFDVSKGSFSGQIQGEFLDCRSIAMCLFIFQGGGARKICLVFVANGWNSEAYAFSR